MWKVFLRMTLKEESIDLTKYNSCFKNNQSQKTNWKTAVAYVRQKINILSK